MLSICEDKDSILWIGTLAGGLNKFDPKNETFEFYTEADGLSNNTIYGLVIDQLENVWVSTNFGISNFNPKTKKFKVFGAGNGLQSNEFNNNAFYISSSGRIYFGGINGFNYFNLRILKQTKFLLSL